MDELLDEAGHPFDREAASRGELSPVFFGSALTNFGVLPFLERFLELAPCPGPPATRNSGSDFALVATAGTTATASSTSSTL